MKVEALRRALDTRTAASGLAVDFHPPATPPPSTTRTVWGFWAPPA